MLSLLLLNLPSGRKRFCPLYLSVDETNRAVRILRSDAVSHDVVPPAKCGARSMTMVCALCFDSVHRELPSIAKGFLCMRALAISLVRPTSCEKAPKLSCLPWTCAGTSSSLSCTDSLPLLEITSPLPSENTDPPQSMRCGTVVSGNYYTTLSFYASSCLNFLLNA